MGGAASGGAGRSLVECDVSNLHATASAQTGVASDWDVWTRACADEAAGRSPELRSAPAGLSHDCVSRRGFKCAQFQLSTFPGSWDRRGLASMRKLKSLGENRGFFSSFPLEEQGTLLIDNPNK